MFKNLIFKYVVYILFKMNWCHVNQSGSYQRGHEYCVFSLVITNSNCRNNISKMVIGGMK